MRPLLLAIAMLAAAPAYAAAPITAAALSPDGKQVVLGSQDGIEIRSWPELVVAGKLATELDHVHDLKFSPDGETLLVAGGSPAEEGCVEVLSWPTGKLARRVTGHDDVVYRVAWSQDGKQWATAGGDGVCQVFAAEDAKRLARYEGHSRPVLSIAYLPDGKTIASVGVDQSLRLWNSASGEHVRTLDNHVGAVNGVAVRPAGSDSPAIVATISEDKTVRLWQPSIGRLMRFARLASVPRAVAWSPNGDRLLVGCNDGRVRVLHPDSVEVVETLDGLEGRIYELVIDPASNRILIGGEAGCRVVEIGR
jgi:WD40 repeat protein